jgi:CheY-like chemotaxis protein
MDHNDFLYFRNSSGYVNVNYDKGGFRRTRRLGHSSAVFALFVIINTIYWVTTSVYGMYCSSDSLLYSSCVLGIVGVLFPGWILVIHRCSYSEKQEKINILQYFVVRIYFYLEAVFAVSGAIAFGLNTLFALSDRQDDFNNESFHHCVSVATNQRWIVCATLETVGLCTIMFPYFVFSFTKSLRCEVPFFSWLAALIFLIMGLSQPANAEYNTHRLVILPVYIVIHVFLGFSMFERERNDYFYFISANTSRLSTVVPAPNMDLAEQATAGAAMRTITSADLRNRGGNHDNNSATSTVVGMSSPPPKSNVEGRNKAHAIINAACEDLLGPLLAAEMGFETLDSLLPKLLSQDFVAVAQAKARTMTITNAVNNNVNGNNANNNGVAAVGNPVLQSSPATVSSGLNNSSPMAVPVDAGAANGVAPMQSISNDSTIQNVLQASTDSNALVTVNAEPRTNNLLPPSGMARPAPSPTNFGVAARDDLSLSINTATNLAASMAAATVTNSANGANSAFAVTNSNDDATLSPTVITILKSITSLMASQRGFCMELLQGMKASAYFAHVLISNLRDTSASLAQVPLLPCYEQFNMAECVNGVVNCASDMQPTVKFCMPVLHDALCGQVYTDKRWFELNLCSLIANAIQISVHHSVEEWPVEVFVTVQTMQNSDKKDVEMIVVEVIDTGGDLTVQQLNDAFELTHFDRYEQPQNAGGEIDTAQQDRLFLQQQQLRSVFNLFALKQRVLALGGLYGARKRTDNVCDGYVFWFAIPLLTNNPNNRTQSQPQGHGNRGVISNRSVSTTNNMNNPSMNNNNYNNNSTNNYNNPSTGSVANRDNKKSRERIESSNVSNGGQDSLVNDVIGDHSDHNPEEDQFFGVPEIPEGGDETNDDDTNNANPGAGINNNNKLKRMHAQANVKNLVSKLSSRSTWLIADDSISILKVMSISLRRLGHTVDTASNGGIALAMMMEREYDFVLMDINMPVLDGLETVTLYRQQETNTLRLMWPYPAQEVTRNRRQIIVGMSADSNVDLTMKRALACGMDAFIAKPMSVDKLIKLVAETKYATRHQQSYHAAPSTVATMTLTGSLTGPSSSTARTISNSMIVRGDSNAARNSSKDDGM